MKKITNYAAIRANKTPDITLPGMRKLHAKLYQDNRQADAWYELGELCRQAGFLNEAVEFYGICLEYDSCFVKALKQRGALYVRMGQYLDAIYDYLTAVCFEDKDPEMWLYRGLAYYFFRDYERADSSFANGIDCAEADSLKAALCVWRWITLSYLNRTAEMTEQIADCAEGSDIFNQLCGVLSGRISPDAISPATIDSEPALEIVHVLYHYYRVNGNAEKASAMLETVRNGIVYEESHWTCFVSHALRQLLGPVAEKDIMPADIKTNTPQVGRNADTFQKLSTLNACLNYAPDAYRVFNSRGKCYLSLGHYGHGVFDLTTATILAPDDSDSWYHLALCYFLCGDYENAEKAQASGTPHAVSVDSVCGINFWHWNTLMLLGRKEEAQKVLEAYYQHLPKVDDFDTYYELTLVQGGRKPMSEVLDALAKLPSNSALTPINRSTCLNGVYLYYLVTGQQDKLNELIPEVTELAYSPATWSAFGSHCLRSLLKK